MDVIVVSGFLGSGKTTLVLAIARELSEARGHKVAIIENEVGKTGIDGERLQAEGFSVREIYSGCICCSLRFDLIQTLLELEKEFDPDIVLLEPSGVAGPRQVRECLLGYGGEIDRWTMISVVDAERLPAISDFSMPLIRDGIDCADLVAINKTDRVTGPQLVELETRIRGIRADVDMIRVAAINGLNQNALFDRITVTPEAAKPALADETEPMPEPAVFAATKVIRNSEGIEDAVSKLLHDLGQTLGQKSDVLIGHIKAIIRARPVGYGVYSLTAADGSVQTTGRLPRHMKEAKVTLNAIAYGLTSDALHECCSERWKQFEKRAEASL